jgi:hypothetical protein
MKKTILFILIFVFAFANISMAKRPGSGEGGWSNRKESMGIPSGKWWKRSDVVNKIDIAEAEKKKLDNMYYKHRYRMIDLHSQVKKDQLELEQLLDNQDFNAEASMDHFTKLQKAHNTRSTERFRFLVQVRELMGLDRFQQLKEQVKKYRMERRRERKRLTKSTTSVK